ncbi:hypothetical protein BBM20_16465 [Vibrio parahaemolyticus]|uniref:hypothetical protein n=1 Tax=Vibrio parahaemolyticus TaxID=670 RepID=UPI00084AF2DB|nr:hypothetical protein [Vibrio parahaemolyticus]EJC7018396.1 hypothetical protein [Vibrio parahaemolyticus]ODY27767.1 hypothetical protein BBM20_16465 [Vibrio parahaemolyticus]
MSLDTLQVIDSAVKIGLGAVIAGVFTQISAKRHFQRELLRKKIDDSKSLIKELALSLENSNIAMTKLASSLRQKIYHGSKVDHDSIAVCHELIVESQACLNIAMANAILLDLREVHELLTQYSAKLNSIINVIDDGIFDQACLDRLQSISNEHNPLRNRLNKLISEAYTNT